MNSNSEGTKPKVEDSLGESGSHTAKSKVTESQYSDTFDEHSQSLSSSANKKGLVYWPGKEQVAIDGSISESKDKSEGGEVFSANAMEEYMKKQQNKSSGQKPAATTTSAPQKRGTGKDISESSDKYTDEDFDSISKSQSHSLPNAPSLAASAQAAKAYG